MVNYLNLPMAKRLRIRRYSFPTCTSKIWRGWRREEINVSPVPSQADLDVLSGDWLKKVSRKIKEEEKEKKEEQAGAVQVWLDKPA